MIPTKQNRRNSLRCSLWKIFLILIFWCTYKKAGPQLLLFRISRLSHCLLSRTSNIEAHADMYTHTHTIDGACRDKIYISRGHQNAAMRWNSFEFARFRNAKHIALNDALYYVRNYPTERNNPRRGQLRCKGTLFFLYMQDFCWKILFLVW